MDRNLRSVHGSGSNDHIGTRFGYGEQVVHFFDGRGQVGVCDEDPFPFGFENASADTKTFSAIDLVCNDPEWVRSGNVAGFIIGAVVHQNDFRSPVVSLEKA